MPELYHPDLDVTIVVDESRARNRRAAGWVDVDEPDDVAAWTDIVEVDADDTVDDDD